MPRFTPFTGLRYDRSRVDLARVVAPPYDVVGPDLRSTLAGRHSANSIVVELPEPEPRSGLDRYAAAAARLAEWVAQGILVRDTSPGFYAYRMTAPDGSTTLGVLGVLGLDPASRSEILPHEETLPKAKSDRLDLLTATRTNLSPIWGLSLAPGLTTLVPVGDPPLEGAIDDDGVLHELWALDDAATIAAIGAAVASAPLVVADGHHRLATAVTYLEGAGSGTPGADGILALVVELADDRLSVGPIHRLLSGLPDGLDLVDVFASWFDVARAGDFVERTTTALGEASALALVMASGCWLLHPKDGTAEAAGSDLYASMVALVVAELPDHELAFANSWQDAVAAVAVGCGPGRRAPPPGADRPDRDWARNRRRMPAKSTFFHPKPRTGMVFRPLDDADPPTGPTPRARPPPLALRSGRRVGPTGGTGGRAQACGGRLGRDPPRPGHGLFVGLGGAGPALLPDHRGGHHEHHVHLHLDDPAVRRGHDPAVSRRRVPRMVPDGDIAAAGGRLHRAVVHLRRVLPGCGRWVGRGRRIRLGGARGGRLLGRRRLEHPDHLLRGRAGGRTAAVAPGHRLHRWPAVRRGRRLGPHQRG